MVEQGMIFKREREILALDTSDIRALSKINPWRSLFALLTDWLIIGAAIGMSEYFKHPIGYIIAWLIVGSRMYALYSLLHDGIHYLLFPQKQVNDFLCRVFLSWPLFIPLNKIRKFHLAHHQHLRTPEDPESAHLAYGEFQFPIPAWKLSLVFLKDITGVNFIIYKSAKILGFVRNLYEKKRDKNREKKPWLSEVEPGMIVFYAGLGLILFYTGTGLKFMMYWLVPYTTIYQALNRLRLSTEHMHIAEDKRLQTRTVDLNFAERLVLSPHNLGFHTEHHLYPSVPFYRLPVLHDRLASLPAYRDNAVVSRSYFDVIREYIQ